MMRLFFLVALPVALALSGCRFGSMPNAIVGSGVGISEDRPIRDVRKVQISGVGTLKLKLSDREHLTVQGDDNLVPLLLTEVVDGKLTISQAPNTTIQTTTPIVYTLELKSLDELELSGATTGDLHGLAGKTLKVTLSGATNATLAGHVDSLKLDASGASKIDAAELKCKSATVHVSGASSATVHAEERLDAHASGASQVAYLGDPKVSEKISGASSVKKR